MISFTVEMKTTFPLNDDEIMERAGRATQEAALTLIRFVREYIDTWTHDPGFYTKPLQRSGRVFICGCATADPIFAWVDYGVLPYSFTTSGYMKFPFEDGGGKYASYSPKIDPTTGKTGANGDSRDLRHGDDAFTKQIADRDIRPRNIPEKALEGRESELYTAFVGALHA